MKGEQWKPSGNVQYILNGGAVLHYLPWLRGFMYDSVSQLYVRYVTQKYGVAEKNKGLCRCDRTLY